MLLRCQFFPTWSVESTQLQSQFGVYWRTDLKTYVRDFPGGPVVKNPPCNAEDEGLIPGRRTKMPHASGQLSPCVPTTTPYHYNEMSCMIRLRPYTAK